MKRQTFNRIRDIKAVGGHIVIYIKEDNDSDYILNHNQLQTQIWTIKETIQRIKAFKIAKSKFPEKEQKVLKDILEAAEAAVKEARQQILLPKNNVIQIAVPNNYNISK